jgi:hypothetical protein
VALEPGRCCSSWSLAHGPFLADLVQCSASSHRVSSSRSLLSSPRPGLCHLCSSSCGLPAGVTPGTSLPALWWRERFPRNTVSLCPAVLPSCSCVFTPQPCGRPHCPSSLLSCPQPLVSALLVASAREPSVPPGAQAPGPVHNPPARSAGFRAVMAWSLLCGENTEPRGLVSCVGLLLLWFLLTPVLTPALWPAGHLI